MPPVSKPVAAWALVHAIIMLPVPVRDGVSKRKLAVPLTIVCGGRTLSASLPGFFRGVGVLIAKRPGSG